MVTVVFSDGLDIIAKSCLQNNSEARFTLLLSYELPTKWDLIIGP